MPIDQDSVPSTVEQAARHIAINVSDDERKAIIESYAGQHHYGFGAGLRNGWSLWEADSPMKRDAATNYGIAHADDISSLILAWAWALVRSDDFDPQQHCQRYHEHWARYGTNSLSAGGWKAGT